MNCSSDLKSVANSWPSASKFKTLFLHTTYIDTFSSHYKRKICSKKVSTNCVFIFSYISRSFTHGSRHIIFAGLRLWKIMVDGQLVYLEPSLVPSMSFYLDFILILSKFHPDFILILSRFYQNYPNFIHFYPDF